MAVRLDSVKIALTPEEKEGGGGRLGLVGLEWSGARERRGLTWRYGGNERAVMDGLIFGDRSRWMGGGVSAGESGLE